MNLHYTYLVLVCVSILRKVLSSFENLIKFNKEYDTTPKKIGNKTDDDEFDLEAEESDDELTY